jgi:very-short-patch-repair endonuclease
MELGKLKNRSFSGMYGKHHSEETKEKIRKANIGRKPSTETLIKLSISQKGKHHHNERIKKIISGYQCDIFIPVQEGIIQKTIIECDGDYWHNYPNGREIDNIRTKELIEKGFKIIRLWEREIKLLNLENLKRKL